MSTPPFASAHVLVVDDNPIRALGIVQVVKNFSYVRAISTCVFADLAETIDHAAPDVVLLAASDAPENDLTATMQPRVSDRAVRFISVGRPTRTRITPSTLSAGLHGFLPSTATPDDFNRALSAALVGFTYFPRSMTQELADCRLRFPQLTPREQQVLDLLSDGMSNHRIASTLGIKEATVKMYVTRVLAKLKVESRLQACLKARGLVSPAA
ncbi:LuxR C-terminal-related transcriptional regulator [Streptomyces filamentosus]|uniref:LuxR C-terminal-related transcriptional regulator n=1 Tax=Streptomyces filamentosus TaxID=67294 RepID=UPI0036E283B4